MPSPRNKVVGSERKPIPNARPVYGANERPDPNHFIEVTLKLRPKAEIPTWATHTGMLSHEQLASDYGTSESDFAAVRRFAQEYNLKVLDEDPLNCSAKVSGTIQDLERAFETRMRNVQVGANIYRERTGHVTLPDYVSQIIEGVFGLDNRRQVKPHFRMLRGARVAKSFTPLDVAKLYKFPDGDGTGETIAILEFGGGYTKTELNKYFSSIGLATPNVTAVLLPGAQNLPTPAPDPTPENPNPPDPDSEVLLDIEIAGAIAPKANIHVYFAKDASEKSFVDCIDKAVTDKPTVISISWGGPESSWTPSGLKSIDQSFARAATLSIPVTVASGDDGSTDGTQPPVLDVDFPSSSPHALACGGTHLEGSSSITKEVVWNSNGGATGGGVSSAFKKPSYQDGVSVPAPSSSSGGRGVPDICGNASPETGFNIQWDGKSGAVGGTSAVAPLWAGLIALFAQKLGHAVPFLNPILYANPSALRDITSGNNDLGNGSGHYAAKAGWDPCTGMGSPNGNALLAILKGGSPTDTYHTTKKPPTTHTHSTTHKPTTSHHTTSHPSTSHHTTEHHTTEHHTTEHHTTHTPPTTHTKITSTGETGSSGAAPKLNDWFQHLPQPYQPPPVIPETAEEELHAPPAAPGPPAIPAKLVSGDIDSEGIVAIVGMVSNVANTAITALTAIATNKKNN
jgi:kumamolisin